MNGVSVNNVVIDGTQCPIYVRLGNRARKYIETAPLPGIGTIKNIQISNINAYNTGNYGSSITAVNGAVIENVLLSNIQISNKGGLKTGEFIPSLGEVKEEAKGYPQPTTWKNLPSYGLFMRNVKNISLSNVMLSSVDTETRVPVIGVHVEKIYVGNFNSGQPKQKTEFQFSNVSDYRFDAQYQLDLLNK
jgi:hypothetical protein